MSESKTNYMSVMLCRGSYMCVHCMCVHIVSPDVDSCDMKTKIEGTKRMHYRIAGNFRWCKFSNKPPKYLENKFS